MKNLNVLIAYNNADISNLLTTIIKSKFDAHIDIAKNAGEFYEYTTSNHYDIIFMDLLFSKNTFQVIEYYRLGNKGNTAPITLLISYLSEADYGKAVELDIFDFLSKPFRLDHIYSILDYILYSKGDNKKSDERRRALRVNKKFLIKYEKDSYRSPVIATEDISISGIRFMNGEGISQNDEIGIKIIINNLYDSRSVDASGIVKWIKKIPDENTAIGVEFCDLHVSDRLRLSNSLYSN